MLLRSVFLQKARLNGAEANIRGAEGGTISSGRASREGPNKSGGGRGVMRVKSILAALAIVAGGAAALGFAWPFHCGGKVLTLPGTVEVHEVRLGPRVAGRVGEVLVTEGDHVSAGQELVRLDVPDLLAQRATLRAKVSEAEAEHHKALNGPRQEEREAALAAVQAAQARLERLEKGNREEEKRGAESEHRAALAEAELAQEEYDRSAKLLRDRAGSRADYDAARATLGRTRGRLAAAKARLDLMQAGSRIEDVQEARAELKRLRSQHALLEKGTRPEEIAAAAARLAEAKAKLAELEVNLSEAVVRAAEPCVVEVLSVGRGDLVQANQPLVRVLPKADLWVKTYVPETDLGKVRLGQDVEVTIDSHPGVRFAGKVTLIGSESEFTPRNVQSVDERRHQMFGVRVQISDAKGVFKSGMAAEVHLAVE
jgi:multidrug resistance efflux pump